MTTPRLHPALYKSEQELAILFAEKIPTRDIYPGPDAYRELLERKMAANLKAFDQDSLNKTVHIVIQNKGGVGKTHVCLLLAQFIEEYCKDIPHRFFDLELPRAKCFSKYQTLNITTFNVTDQQGNIDPGKFDEIFNPIFEGDVTDGVILIDVGAGLFYEVLRYLSGLSQIIPEIQRNGWRVCIHTVVTGDDVGNCMAGYDQIRTILKGDYHTVIWLNNYLGMTQNAFLGSIFNKYRDDFTRRSIMLPPREKEMENIFAFIRRYKIRFSDLGKYTRVSPPEPDVSSLESGDESQSKPLTVSALDARRLDNYLHMTQTDGFSKRDGVFELLRQFDWRFGERASEGADEMADESVNPLEE